MFHLTHRLMSKLLVIGMTIFKIQCVKNISYLLSFSCHRCCLIFLVSLSLVLSSLFLFLSSFICLPRILGSSPKSHPKHDTLSVWAPPFSLPLGLVLPSWLKEYLKWSGPFSSIPSIQVQVCICFAFEFERLLFEQFLTFLSCLTFSFSLSYITYFSLSSSSN